MSNASGAESLAIQPQKLLILDARSYAAAVANRAKGGGCECPGKYCAHCLCTVLCTLFVLGHLHPEENRSYLICISLIRVVAGRDKDYEKGGKWLKIQRSKNEGSF